MRNLTDYIVNGILLVGIGLISVSFSPIQHLIDQIPPGGLRRKWNDLRALVLFFIVGYASFTYLYWLKKDDNFNLIVPAVFFLAAVLILFVGMLALETATEIKETAALKYENITDHLIGIYNRRYLDRKIAEELPRASRYNLPLSMLLLDIDHFKTVNDTYGHQIGDQTLKSLGQVLFKKTRDTDIIARYGGEEIAVLALHTSITDAVDLAERLRKAVETAIMVPADEAQNRPAITITVSIGVTGLDQQTADHHVLIERADKALYKAKQGGRNRVIVFDSTA
jgi:diguanylate cyclase (GGDEF)-like protein